MYFNQRSESTPVDQFSIAAAEAYCMLMQLKERYPKEYAVAESEFNEVYLLGVAIAKVNKQ